MTWHSEQTRLEPICQSPAGELTVRIKRAIPAVVTMARNLIIRSSTSQPALKQIAPNHQTDSGFCLSFEILVTTYAQRAARLQSAEILEVGAVHVVAGGGAGQLSPGIGISDPHGMGSGVRHRFMALGAEIYRVSLEQRLSFWPVVLVTGQTALVRGVPVSLAPVFIQLVTSVTQGMVNALLSGIGRAVAERTLGTLRMRIGSALAGSPRERAQGIALGKD
jgi:hypothetical protein